MQQLKDIYFDMCKNHLLLLEKEQKMRNNTKIDVGFILYYEKKQNAFKYEDPTHKNFCHLEIEFNRICALYEFFINNDIQKYKEHYYIAGRFQQYLLEKYDEKLHFQMIKYFIHSDNSDLINYFVHYKFKDNAQKDVFYYFIVVIQHLLNKETVNNRQLNYYLDEFNSHLRKKFIFSNIDYEILKGLFYKDSHLIESNIYKILERKEHKRRSRIEFDFSLYSEIGIFYLKIANILGIKIEINSTLMPKAILDINPLDSSNYIEPDFITEYFS